MYLEKNSETAEIELIKEMIKNLQDNQKNGEFCGKEDRLIASGIACLIKDGNNIAGFLYLLNEGKEKFNFLDMVILPEYRNKGLGYLALEELLKRYDGQEFILAEVKDNNVACIKMLKKLKSIKISDKYYLLQPERINELCEYMNGRIDFINLYDEFKLNDGNNNKQKIKKMH